VIVGQVNLTFYTVVAGVVLEVLDRLGHQTQVSEGTHPAIYARLGRGEVDLFVASWLPHAHGSLHQPLAGQLTEVTTFYEDALLYWSVPAHVPAKLVRSIDDLKRAEVLARMDREIVGVGPGSGLMVGSSEILRRYGLAEHGYTLRTAPAAEWAARLDEAVAEGRWIVMPLWRPQYLNAVHAPRVLDEPLGVFAPDRCVLVARTEAWLALPERSRVVLGRMALDLATVTELERQMVIERKDARTVARNWMAEDPRVIDWFK
jgi:glycine betaine/proline transport system substrate-binding protein